MRRLAPFAVALLGLAGWSAGCRDKGSRTGATPGSPAADEASSAAATEALPHPALEGLEPELAAELGRRRTEVEAVLADASIPAAERGSAVGQLGRVYQAHRMLDVAEDCYRLAHNLEPEAFAWAYYLGVLAAASGKPEEAKSAFETALELRPGDLPSTIRLADLELDSGSVNEAEILYRRASTLDPSHAAAIYGLGRAAFERRDYEAAVEHFGRALELQPQASVIHYQLGQAYRQLGDLEWAQRHLAQSGKARVAMADPLMYELTSLALGASPHVSRGTELLREGRVSAALEQFRLAIEADPDNPEAHHRLASVLVRMGYLDTALLHFEEVARLRPGSAQAEADVAAVLGELGENERALERLLRAVELDPDLEQAQFNLANTLARLGRHEAAAARYRRVLDMDPDHPEARERLATTLAQSGDVDEAIRELREVVAHRPDNAGAQLNLGVALAESGDLEAAIATHQTALGLELPTTMLAQIHFNLAAFNESAGHLAEAALHYGKVDSLQPAHPEAWLRRVAVLLRLGRDSEALWAIESRVEAQPEDGRAVQTLARMLAAVPTESLRDGDRAMELARRVFEARPEPPSAETLAMALAQQGRFEEADKIQRSLLAEAERLGRSAAAERLRRNLGLYESGRTCCAEPRDLLPAD